MSVAINGFCDEKFAAIQQAFTNNFDQGKEVGASLAVTIHGQPVVDLWAGFSDAASSKPWQEDTIVNVWSSTKTMSALVMLMLADSGEIDFYQKVAHYWPEFAQNGKADIEVRHIMSHSAGLPGTEVATSAEDFYDHDKIAELLAAQAPWFEAGTTSAYHLITQGQLQAEIVRRVTGNTLGNFFRQQIAEPLQADFHIGTPAALDHRIAELVPFVPSQAQATDPNSISSRARRGPTLSPLAARELGWRRAEIPAANGHGNARSIAKIHSVLASGGAGNGWRLLSKEGCQRIFDQQTAGIDQVLGSHTTFGMGFALNSQQVPLGPNANTCYWGGWGGSLALIDMDAGVSFSYVMNKMEESVTGDDRTPPMLMALYQALA